jgi:pimeloyl-ACP methyl ester carboxylesterase
VRRTRNPILLAVLVLALVALPACAKSAAQRRSRDLTASHAVTFRSRDGVRLAGRMFGTGTVGVVLSHMLPADQTSWWDFADELAGRGYRALTYDFRGYCPGGDAGCSGGHKQISAMWQDVLGAIDEIRSAGAERVVLIGASMGGTASLVAASKPGVQVQAIVTLSAPTSIEGLVADQTTLSTVTAAKLFIAGNGDPTGAADAAQQLYDTSPQPKRVDIVTSNDHGTNLLTGNQSGIVPTTILNYLQEYAAP